MSTIKELLTGLVSMPKTQKELGIVTDLVSKVKVNTVAETIERNEVLLLLRRITKELFEVQQYLVRNTEV